MNRLLTAHTPLGKALWAVSLEGREAMSTLYHFTVRFKSGDANIDSAKARVPSVPKGARSCATWISAS